MYYMYIKLLFVEKIYGEKREMTFVEKSNLGPSGSFIWLNNFSEWWILPQNICVQYNKLYY